MMRRIAVLFAALLLGCASAEGADSQWQTLANTATKAFNVGPVYIDESGGGPSYRCREMRIFLPTQAPGWNFRSLRRTLAHELGHHIRRHCGESAANEAEANAVAVEVLQVWGATREQALQAIAHMLYGNRAVRSNSLHDFCGELREFLARFPEAVDPRAPGECAG